MLFDRAFLFRRADLHVDVLNFGAAVRVFHLDRHMVGAAEIRFRAIERDERRHLQREAFLVIRRADLGALDDDLAVLRLGAEPDRRQRAGRAIRQHVDIDADADIPPGRSLGRALDNPHLRFGNGMGRETAKKCG
jgi:hypothetical protein